MGSHRPSWMDKDLDALADLARRFFEFECAPKEERWCAQQHADRDVWRRVGELGLLCMSIPEQYGGGGGTFAHDAVLSIEQVRALAPSFGGMQHSGIFAHYLNAYGTEEQRHKWLPPMASGEIVTAIAMTEPGTGSDLQALRTTAVTDGDDYVINGAKTFISNGMLADLVVVAAKTAQRWARCGHCVADRGGNRTIRLSPWPQSGQDRSTRSRHLRIVLRRCQSPADQSRWGTRRPRVSAIGAAAAPGTAFTGIDRDRGDRGNRGPDPGLHPRSQRVRQAAVRLPEHPVHPC